MPISYKSLIGSPQKYEGYTRNKNTIFPIYFTIEIHDIFFYLGKMGDNVLLEYFKLIGLGKVLITIDGNKGI